MAVERRWPIGAALLAVLFLLHALPGRVAILPHWAVYAMGAAVAAPIAGVALSDGAAGWLRAERWIVLSFVVTAAASTVINLGTLLRAIVSHSGLTGLQLLTSSTGIWATNVLAFALLYWEIDRGGPALRQTAPAAARPDWVFPQETMPQLVAPNWRPAFSDYLFLAFTTATAFSPTGALPLTARAMLLMMAESVVSLVTVLVTAARAINVLGG